LHSDEHKALYRATFKGKHLSPEHIEKVAASRRGKKQSPEYIQKRMFWAKGHTWRPETIAKRAAALRGKKRTGQAYQNILEGVAHAQGYDSYAAIPHMDDPNWRGPDWPVVRKEILKRDNYTCQTCGSEERLQVHHKVNWRLTQDNSPENLITLCIFCHQSLKGSRIIMLKSKSKACSR